MGVLLFIATKLSQSMKAANQRRQKSEVPLFPHGSDLLLTLLFYVVSP